MFRMWGLKVKRGSRVMPRILGVLLVGILKLLIVTWGVLLNCLFQGEKMVTVDLLGAMLRWFVAAQSATGVRTSERFVASCEQFVVRSVADSAMETSSAYDDVTSADVGRSWRKKLKMHGDKTDPCGTPECIILVVDFDVRYSVEAVRPLR